MLFSSFLKKKKLLIVVVVFFPGTFFGMQNCSNRYLIFKQAEGLSFENIQTGIDFNGCLIKNISDFEESSWTSLTTENFYDDVAKVFLVKPSADEQSLECLLQQSHENKNSVLELSFNQAVEARKALLFINKAIINQSEKRPTCYDLSLDDESMRENGPAKDTIYDLFSELSEASLHDLSYINIFDK